MKPKRVLHVVSSLSVTNGITSLIMNYYRYIDRKEIQFDFLYFVESEQSYEEEIKSLGGRIINIAPPSKKTILSYNLYLKNSFEEYDFEYEVVHSHEIPMLTFLAPTFKKLKVKHIIAHTHSVSYSYKLFNNFRNRLLSLPLKYIANSYFSCSEASAKFWFGEKMMKENSVTIVKNAIDCERFQYNPYIRREVRKKLKLENEFVIGHVGRLCKEKNQLQLIDIFNTISKENINSTLLLIGEGSLKGEIVKKVNKLGLVDKVKFLGETKEVENLYQAMDIFVFPSLSEGLGIAAIEAQTSGLPCIISTSVTPEVNIYSAKFISLKKAPEEWAKAIYSASNDRSSGASYASKNGYCIIDAANQLEKSYSNIFNQL